MSKQSYFEEGKFKPAMGPRGTLNADICIIRDYACKLSRSKLPCGPRGIINADLQLLSKLHFVQEGLTIAAI